MSESIRVLYPAHTSARTPPQNLKPEDAQFFEHELCKEIGAFDVRIIKPAFILGNSIFIPGLLRFYTRATHYGLVTNKKKIAALKLLARPGKFISKALWITDVISDMYFHWTTDALARLLVAQQIDNTAPVVIPGRLTRHPFVLESLKFLQVPFEVFDDKRCYYVQKLITPNRIIPNGNYNKQIIEKLRDKLRFQLTTKQEARRIFISRSKAGKRKILNEAELLPLLQEFNFEVHQFEDYNFSEQANIAGSAAVIIGLHGAGLSNMIFMAPGGTVIELRNRGDAHNNCFFSLASDLEHKYYYLLNEGTDKDTHVANINVDINKLREVLNLALGG